MTSLGYSPVCWLYGCGTVVTMSALATLEKPVPILTPVYVMPSNGSTLIGSTTVELGLNCSPVSMSCLFVLYLYRHLYQTLPSLGHYWPYTYGCNHFLYSYNHFLTVTLSSPGPACPIPHPQCLVSVLIHLLSCLSVHGCIRMV